jgi:hypothetical protein
MGKTRKSGMLFLVYRYGETMSALATPVVENLAAVGRSHAYAKTVGAQPAGTMRLVGALHDDLPDERYREQI